MWVVAHKQKRAIVCLVDHFSTLDAESPLVSLQAVCHGDTPDQDRGRKCGWKAIVAPVAGGMLCSRVISSSRVALFGSACYPQSPPIAR